MGCNIFGKKLGAFLNGIKNNDKYKNQSLFHPTFLSVSFQDEPRPKSEM
jgi:hypothetical protein